MNIPHLSPSSFHDANQDPSPASGLNATPPASADAVTTPSDNNTYNHEALRVRVLCVFLSSTLSIRLLRPMRMNSVLKEPNPDTGRINIRA
jgi:hypothetical protein